MPRIRYLCALLICTPLLAAPDLTGGRLWAAEPQSNLRFHAEAESAAQTPTSPKVLRLADSQRRRAPVVQTPDSSVTTQRSIPDPANDFFHQGHFAHRDDLDRPVAEGDYVEGKRTGKWTRWLVAGEGDIFNGPPYDEFSRPFVSQATFKDGKIVGAWTVDDRAGRNIGRWEIDDAGRPHGQAQWWYPNGQKLRQVQYLHGVVHGQFREWDPEGNLLVSENFHAGRKIATATDLETPDLKRAEGTYLVPGQVQRCTINWWNAAVLVDIVADHVTEDRHGTWTWWYPDGKTRLQANYFEGISSGKFIWWHPNSQKQIEGNFTNGRADGQWTWYHANSMKQLTGRYVAGEQVGKWHTYDEDGKLVTTESFKPSKMAHASDEAPPSEPISTMPAAPTLPSDSSPVRRTSLLR